MDGNPGIFYFCGICCLPLIIGLVIGILIEQRRQRVGFNPGSLFKTRRSKK